MSSNTSTSDHTSSLSQLFARILLNEALYPYEMHSRTNRVRPNTRNSILELFQHYNESINAYNTNMAQYNLNVDRIIRLLENEQGILQNNTPMAHQSNTYSQSTYETPNVVSPGISQSTYETPNVVSPGIPQSTYETPNVVSSGISQSTYETPNVVSSGISQSQTSYTSSIIPNLRMDISSVMIDGSGSGVRATIPNNTPSLLSSAFPNYTGRPTYTQRRPYAIQTYNSIINSFLTLPLRGQYMGRYINRPEGLTESQIQNATMDVIFDASNNTLLYDADISRDTSEALFEVPTQCPISLEEFTNGEHLLQIRECKHVFKPVELRRWLSRHTQCPVCRCNVTLNGIYVNSASSTDNTENVNDNEDYSDMPYLAEDIYENDTTNTNTNTLFREYGGGLYNHSTYNYLEEDDNDNNETIYQMEVVIRPPTETNDEEEEHE